MNNGLIVADFNGHSIRTEEREWFNGPDLADAGGKSRDYARQWLRSAEGKEYVALAESKRGNTRLVRKRHGGKSPGIWLHYKVARRFAQSCSAELAWWVDEFVEAKCNDQPIETAEYHLIELQKHLLGTVANHEERITVHDRRLGDHDKRFERLESKRKIDRIERRVRDWVQYREGGFREHVLCTGEKVDVINHETSQIIECKIAKEWRDAVRQIMEYSRYIPGYQRRIHLFGQSTEVQMRMCKERCKWDGIILTVADPNDTINDPPPRERMLF